MGVGLPLTSHVFALTAHTRRTSSVIFWLLGYAQLYPLNVEDGLINTCQNVMNRFPQFLLGMHQCQCRTGDWVPAPLGDQSHWVHSATGHPVRLGIQCHWDPVPLGIYFLIYGLLFNKS
jgi:hypothetical protein